MSGEKLEPVRAESQLRVGMIVVVRNCEVCGRQWCRAMFMGRTAPCKCDECGSDSCHGFLLEPNCGTGPDFCGSWDFGSGDIFRVVDGLDEKADLREAQLDRQRLKLKETAR